MKKTYLFFISLLFSCSVVEAQNLVPNYSFEDTVACPTNLDQVNKALGWSAFRQSPDYFNICSSSQFVSIPNTNFGYQYPRSGNGFVGMHCYLGGNGREIVGVQLFSALSIGERYYASFYTVRALGGPLATLNIAINKIGMRLSTVPYSFSSPIPINNIAQIFSDSVISDTLNWIKVSGSFIADSAYEYLCLGNFFDNANTTAIHYDSTSGFSYYFIDDVFLSTDSTIGIPEIPNYTSQIQITPNPFHTTFTLHSPSFLLNTSITIYNSLGEIVHRQIITATEQQINLHIAEGIYFLQAGSTIKKLVVY